MIEGPRVTNDKVIHAWTHGLSAQNHNGTFGSISYPNGRAELFSYELKIGERTKAGVCVLADYTAPAGGFKSMTTSQHVCLTKHTIGKKLVIMNPRVWQCSPLSEDKPF
tara:strand:+ start:403 stop:729 length:327 start_codon:yes stop_codon:yes gene_type:complete